MHGDGSQAVGRPWALQEHVDVTLHPGRNEAMVLGKE